VPLVILIVAVMDWLPEDVQVAPVMLPPPLDDELELEEELLEELELEEELLDDELELEEPEFEYEQ
jgi:hypothetical protein